MSAARIVIACIVLGASSLVGCADDADELVGSASVAKDDAGTDHDDGVSRPEDDRTPRATRDAGAEATVDATTATPTPTPTATPTPTETVGPLQSCQASYYESSGTTASGEVFDPDGLTAAHKTFPFGTIVRVINPTNGKSVDVRINDRGPFGSASRCLDLARGAFAKLAPLSAGVLQVKYGVVKK